MALFDLLDEDLDGDFFSEKKLSTKAHKKDATIKPSKDYPAGRFPMPDKDHAAKALQLLPRAKGLSTDQKKKIRAKANRILGKKK